MGNTRNPTQNSGAPPVHPHTHGEHYLPAVTSIPVLRFIPTRMGNTAVIPDVWPFCAVHPHTHGEHEVYNGLRATVAGSSPHAWGTRICAAARRQRAGFIPTRMGNTAPPSIRVSPLLVHPHTHGEHSSSYYPWKEVTFYAFAIKRCIASGPPLSVAGDAFL